MTIQRFETQYPYSSLLPLANANTSKYGTKQFYRKERSITITTFLDFVIHLVFKETRECRVLETGSVSILR
jgi:hypothetical protein